MGLVIMEGSERLKNQLVEALETSRENVVEESLGLGRLQKSCFWQWWAGGIWGGLRGNWKRWGNWETSSHLFFSHLPLHGFVTMEGDLRNGFAM